MDVNVWLFGDIKEGICGMKKNEMKEGFGVNTHTHTKKSVVLLLCVIRF